MNNGQFRLMTLKEKTMGMSINLRRVVVTSMGIVSPLGNNVDEVRDNLFNGVSGVAIDPEFIERGFSCQISARVKDFPELNIDRKMARALNGGKLIAFAYEATRQALESSGLTLEQIESDRTGIFYGNGGPDTETQVNDSLATLNKGSPANSALSVFPAMVNGPAGFLSTYFKLKRMNQMLGGACATSNLTIGEAALKIATGLADVMVAGGTERAHWTLAQHFDMIAMCKNSNDDPQGASKPFDAKASGFVLGEGAGTIILESLEHALARDATILAEVVGYGNSGDGYSLTSPSVDGAVRSMREALGGFYGLNPINVIDVDYLNAHGTSTPAGDPGELTAVHEVFGKFAPYITSTKGVSGHSLGAAGIHEAIYTLLMMQSSIIPASANITQPHPKAIELGLEKSLVRETLLDQEIKVAMSNGFGFGGVNSTLIFRKYEG